MLARYIINVTLVTYNKSGISMPILQMRSKIRRVLNTDMSQYEVLSTYSQVLAFIFMT